MSKDLTGALGSPKSVALFSDRGEALALSEVRKAP